MKDAIIRKIGDLKSIIDDKQDELLTLNRELDALEIDLDEFEDAYNNMLDECYPELFNMQPSYILRECDPIAYRCGLNDYCDGQDIQDTDEYKELAEQIDELESEISGLEDEVIELESKLENVED